MACGYQPTDQVPLDTAVATYGLQVKEGYVVRELERPYKGALYARVDYNAIHSDATVVGGQVFQGDSINVHLEMALDHTQS